MHYSAKNIIRNFCDWPTCQIESSLWVEGCGWVSELYSSWNKCCPGWSDPGDRRYSYRQGPYTRNPSSYGVSSTGPSEKTRKNSFNNNQPQVKQSLVGSRRGLRLTKQFTSGGQRSSLLWTLSFHSLSWPLKVLKFDLQVMHLKLFFETRQLERGSIAFWYVWIYHARHYNKNSK